MADVDTEQIGTRGGGVGGHLLLHTDLLVCVWGGPIINLHLCGVVQPEAPRRQWRPDRDVHLTLSGGSGVGVGGRGGRCHTEPLCSQQACWSSVVKLMSFWRRRGGAAAAWRCLSVPVCLWTVVTETFYCPSSLSYFLNQFVSLLSLLTL